MKRRILVFVLFVGALALLYAVARRHLAMETLVAHEAGLRAWLEAHPWRGFGIAFAVYIAVSLVPGLTGKAIIAGWLVGFWRGLVLVNLGLTAAALIGFVVSRTIFGDLVERRWSARLARVRRAIQRDGPSYLFAARVLHAPFTLTNWLMGASQIRPRGFWWATQLGILPGNIVFVYAGAQAPSLAEIQAQGVMSLLSPGVIIAFVALSVLPLLLPRLVRAVLTRLGHGAAAETEGLE